MIYTPPSRPKGRSRTGNLPVRVVFYGFFCRHGDKAPLFCFVRRMISAQAAKGGRPAGEPPLCSLWFPASPSGCALQGGRSGLRNPVSAARLFSHVCRAAPDPAGGPPAPAALPHRFGNFYSKPHLREKAGCACIVYKSGRFGYSRLHENSERFFTNSENLVSLYLGSRPALHGSAERPARRRPS